ncbi:hypothetical protein ANOM_003344 [Aspergillus nomiae NRRL 13137]|uniref:ATP-grasp domain-containing protein n=1 Tax=Aspergillus nomiae NRRL (strain ATCC 15546 / NRRL 13137 / CBS 260.88 / M93) TaxID=1509407 RepID=A0A0L1J8X0_ASPN3|nr:uncharacterized protein ANOM_003344 [Aspergillus nomiae NRRL 13137]KNG88140.1 hypothetical protein ANOM_003344 [Aspergillus nomiae NRRL 13137]
MHAHTRPVVLDYTLEDLYSLDGGKASDVVLAFAFPIPRVQAASSLPLSKGFTYQSPLAEYPCKQDLAKKLLQGIPQRYGFISGKMPLVLFELDLDEHEKNGQDPPAKLRAHHIDTMEVYKQLSPDQQPKVSFARSPEDVVLPPNVRLAVLSPVDCLAHLPHVVDPQAHYNLLSKRGLAYSGLPTPPSVVIDSHLLPSQVHDSCLVDAEVQRMLRTVHEKDLPFIVKVPQSISGQGTFILRTESDRQDAIAVLQEELREMIQEVHPTNQHLSPCSLIIQDFLEGETMALSLFVTCKGRGIFIGYTKQLFNDNDLWVGGCISYPEQPQREQEYAEFTDELARFLYSKGYYGPAGVDFMIGPDGRFLVLDMNIRVTGTYHLGCLRGHFMQRGFSEATMLYPVYIGCSRDEFRDFFRNEFKDGSMILSSWTTNPHPKPHSVSITIAGVDRVALNSLIEKVNAFSASVTRG